MQAKQLSKLSSLKHLLNFASNPLATLGKVREKYGDFAVLRLGGRSIFLCFHPDLAEDVFQKNQASFCKSRSVFDPIIPLTGDRGLVQLEGREGLVHRRHTVKAFSSSSLLGYLPVFAENFSAFRASMQQQMKNDSPFDLAPLMEKLVLNNALSMVIGTFDSSGTEGLLEDFRELNILCGAEIRKRHSLSSLFRRQNSRQVRNVETKLSQKITRLIENGKSSPKESLIKHLFQGNLDPKQIEHHVRTFLFAGFETTTTSILMSLYLLAKNSEVKQAIQQEVASQDLEDMTSLRRNTTLMNSYKEALRLFPPSWTLAREAVQTTRIGSQPIHKGDQVFFGLNEIHRHKDFWDHPNAFNPHRFKETGRHEFAYLPFGAGPRVCIGMQTAFVEACYIIGSFIKDFDFTIPGVFSPSMRAQITSHPTNGLPIHIQARRVYAT